jgi:DNA-binding NtrC family response regulator
MRQRLSILIVEDSIDDALILERELRQGGFEIATARVDCPRDLIDALQRQDWDIVISDYSMPSFSALDALKIVKESGIDLPFIIVSGAIGEDVAVAAMRNGAHDYMMKARSGH